MKGTQVIFFRPDARARVFFRQLLGNLALGLAFIAWLKIPDSHVWQFAASMLIIAALLAGFLWLHATTIQTLREPSLSRPRRISYPILLVWLAFWYTLIALLQAAFTSGDISKRAGFWNSRLSSHLRHTFTYERLSNWQHDLLEVLLWWLLPTLLLPLIVETVARGWRTLRQRETWRVYRRPSLWLGTGLAALVTFWLADLFNTWHPGHSVAGELISLALRYAFIYCMGIAVYCLVLMWIAQLLAREHTAGDAAPQPSANG